MADCKYQDQMYSEGSVTCQSGKEYECVDGRWKYTGRDCENDENNLIINSTSTVAGSDAKHIVMGNQVSAFASKCFSYYIISLTTVGLRNKCTQCKVAVINFNYFDGRHELKHIQVNGKSSVEVNMVGAQTTEIIDDEDC